MRKHIYKKAKFQIQEQWDFRERLFHDAMESETNRATNELLREIINAFPFRPLPITIFGSEMQSLKNNLINLQSRRIKEQMRRSKDQNL